jgi:phytoene dehydrogenase-like protein
VLLYSFKVSKEKVGTITGIPLWKETQIIFSATPRTMKHYGGMSDGAIMGAGLYLDQSFSKRTQTQTPIKNLFLAGAYSSYPGIGLSLDSGIVTSNIVLNSRII